MIGELLRLKVRLLGNAFRVPRGGRWAAAGILLGFVLVVLFWMAAALARQLDAVTLVRVVVVVGALVSVGAFLVPLMLARSHILPPRALRLFGMRPVPIGLAILGLTLVGPAALFVPIAAAPLVVWQGPEWQLAALAVPLIVLEGFLASRIGVVLGAVLKYRPIAGAVIRSLAVLLLLLWLAVIVAHLAPTVAELLPGTWWPITLTVVVALAPLRHPMIADTLSALPLGAFWRAPAHDYAERADLVQQDLILGAVTIGALGLVWIASLAYMLRPTRRVPGERAALVPGWFRRLPSTPTGAVAARSFTYWRRDPRYAAALLFLPLVPAVTLSAMLVAGIPLSVAVLLPLPLVMLLLAWGTLHNDVAYDSTALWTHLAAQTSGIQDRVGRMLPVLTLGIPIALVGTALTAWGHGDWLVAPAVLGVALGLLFGGIGVSSIFSVRYPYPATRPGDTPFQQPQIAGETGGGTQAGSMLLVLLVAGPALTALILYLLGIPGPWTWVALAAGVGVGAVVLLVGIRAGGKIFDRRAPELLEFAVRH